jgi:hypothetical protein
MGRKTSGSSSGRTARTPAKQTQDPPEPFMGGLRKYLSKTAKLTAGPGFPFLVMAMCASIGGAIMLFTTQWGVGVTTDSTIYINVARNLLQGYGWSHPPGSPMTHYPPLYPLVLSLSGLLGSDPIDGARWVQAFLFFATLLCSGVMIYGATNSSTLAWITGLLLLLTSNTMIYVYDFAWSESLFILLCLAGFLLLGKYFEESRQRLLLASSIMIGLAFLTRYAGVSLVITGCLCILLISPLSIYKRFIATMLFAVVSVLPTGLWFIRNRIVSGTLANRTLVSHPITANHVDSAILTISRWLCLPEDWPLRVRGGILVIFAVIILTGYVILLKDQLKNNENQKNNHILYIPSLLIIFTISYLSFLAMSISFIDAHTPFDDRILAPLYVVSVIGIVCLAYNIWLQFGKKRVFAALFLIVSFLFVGVQIIKSTPLVASLHYEGIGFSSKYWRYSKIIEIVKSVPPDTIIYTNGPDAIDILTGKSSLMIPSKVDPGTRLSNENFAAQFADMARQLETDKSILVYFYGITWRWYLPTKEEIAKGVRLRVLYQGRDGIIYGAE